jgi:hypothetical protein
MEPWLQDGKPWLGLGHDQHRASWAAVTHRPLVGLASALLPPLRLERTGPHAQTTRHQAAPLATAAAQDQRWSLLWEDLNTARQEACHDHPVIAALERLRVA